MTGPHLTPEREAEIRAAAKRGAAFVSQVSGVLAPGWGDVRLLLAALDAERAAHNLTRTALTDGAEVVARNLAAISHWFGPTVFVRELDQWAQEAQRVLGLAVAEADKPHDGNER